MGGVQLKFRRRRASNLHVHIITGRLRVQVIRNWREQWRLERWRLEQWWQSNCRNKNKRLYIITRSPTTCIYTPIEPWGGGGMPWGGGGMPCGGRGMPWGGSGMPWGGRSMPWGGRGMPCGGRGMPWGGKSMPWGGRGMPWGPGKRGGAPEEGNWGGWGTIPEGNKYEIDTTFTKQFTNLQLAPVVVVAGSYQGDMCLVLSILHQQICQARSVKR